MEAIREAVSENPALYIAIGGFLIGFVFGFVVNWTNFCTMGSISDIVSFGDWRRLRAWLLASGTALAGAQLLHAAGVVDLNLSMYLGATLNWPSHVIGGLMFGFGMVFAGGCASRNIARIGGGDLRSVFVLIFVGLFAYMTIGGIIAPVRSDFAQATALDLSLFNMDNQGTGTILARLLSADPVLMTRIIAAALAGGIFIFCFSSKDFRSSPPHVTAGLVIGLAVIAGWALTGLAYDEMADNPVRPISLSYVRPAGDTMEYLTRFTALGAPGFGVVTVFGAVFGSFVAAILQGNFQITTFAGTGDTLRNMFGAALMGIGGVMALGCTIGQAITGFSTLAFGSMISFAFIVIGGVIGMKTLERILLAEA